MELQQEITPEASSQVIVIPPLPPPPCYPQHRATYVVQVPKDQIFRVPPPENDLIVDFHRNAPAKSRSKLRLRILWTCLAIAIVTALIGITLGVLFAVFSPKPPTFSVANVVFKSGETKNSKPQCEISLNVKNPNDKLIMDNADDGVASLTFKEKNVAKGKFPTLSKTQNNNPTEVKVLLTASNKALPEEMEESMNDKKTKKPMSLGLNVKVALKFELWGIKSWIKESEITCQFKVTTARQGTTRILSQNCETIFD